MYGLSEAGILANIILITRLKEHDNFEMKYTNVDDVGVKCIRKEDAEYLISTWQALQHCQKIGKADCVVEFT